VAELQRINMWMSNLSVVEVIEQANDLIFDAATASREVGRPAPAMTLRRRRDSLLTDV
jgi:hypothetical protein